MRVAVDGRSLGERGRGVARYLAGMLSALPAGLELRVVLPRGAVLPPGLGANVVGVRHAAPSRMLHGAAAIARRPRLERIADGADLVWLPAPAPVAVGRGTPMALTLHDLSFLERPGDFTSYERLWHRLARPRALARRAARVMAVSEDTARRARERFGLDPARVCVVPAGPGDRGPRAGPGDVTAARTRHGLPDRYFVFVGALEPRKAVDRLVAALPAGEALVVVGGGRLADALRGPGVHRVGPVDGAEKAALYAGALAVVLPSWCEGYGYPPLEGYAQGTPAIVSDLPALRETAGAGAVYVPPGDVTALAAALREVAADEALRARLIAGGSAALATRSWEAAGAALHAALEEAAGA
jgi:glycosyltransferase involved in cell wall biosynthesis